MRGMSKLRVKRDEFLQEVRKAEGLVIPIDLH